MEVAVYCNGEYYQTNSLSEAMTQHDLSHRASPQNRSQAITHSVVRWMFLAPCALYLGGMALWGAAELVHLVIS